MGKKYVDLVVDNYGTNFEKANNEIDTALNDFYVTIDTILKENKFPEEQMTKWTTLLETASVKAAELKIKIEEKYKQMTEKAGYYDEIVSEAMSIVDAEVTTDVKYNAEKSERDEYFWKMDSAKACPEIDDGYPWVFYTTSVRHSTRKDMEHWWWNEGTKQNTTHSQVIKTKEELEALPGFSKG